MKYAIILFCFIIANSSCKKTYKNIDDNVQQDQLEMLRFHLANFNSETFYFKSYKTDFDSIFIAVIEFKILQQLTEEQIILTIVKAETGVVYNFKTKDTKFSCLRNNEKIDGTLKIGVINKLKYSFDKKKCTHSLFLNDNFISSLANINVSKVNTNLSSGVYVGFDPNNKTENKNIEIRDVKIYED
ncbi:MAG: hypothetical protein H7296_06975 [Bacteroidia bacterium]|nr:hypothetical protein [Bacteroidia bacterium]